MRTGSHQNRIFVAHHIFKGLMMKHDHSWRHGTFGLAGLSLLVFGSRYPSPPSGPNDVRRSHQNVLCDMKESAVLLLETKFEFSISIIVF